MKTTMIKQVLLLAFIVTFVSADMYFHSPMGSNNRLDEANRERNNGNRMFDSQNNDRGGYNVGKMNYYEDEEIPIKFTVQHGCNNPGTKECELILQMMCDPLIRDGTTTTTIPTNNANCRNFNCDTDVKYGRHESQAYYEQCQNTARNERLFTASQNLKKDRARYTRQNPDGTRRGYECPEERDYYPYWRPSPWIDLAVFTSSTDRCNEYQRESENVKGRGWCNVPNEVRNNNQYKNKGIPITMEDCNWSVTNAAGNTTASIWEMAPSHGWPAPACIKTSASRSNHLGLIGSQNQWTYDMKIPKFLKDDEESTRCVMRIRYNITEDYNGWTDNQQVGSLVTSAFNAENTNNKNAANAVTTLPVWEEYGFTQADMQECIDSNNRNNRGDCREYIFVDNPRVDPVGQKVGNNRLKLQIAMNTAQYGRTFQDRSHVFSIQKTPSYIDTSKHKLKLQTMGGKRGNIVQTFPGTEYFMYPETLNVRANDFIHFAWTGSNTNPNNNDGQGKQGTDRSNMAPMKFSNYVGGDTQDVVGSLRTSYPGYVQQPEGYDIPIVENCRTPDAVVPPVAGLSQDIANQLATGRTVHVENLDYGNMEELDDAPTSFDMLPQQAKLVGCWAMMGTRNNNFSNRSQKSTVCVNDGEVYTADVGPGGASFSGEDGWLDVANGSLTETVALRYETHPHDEDSVSRVHQIYPIELPITPGTTVEIGIPYDKNAMMKPKLMHRRDASQEWEEHDAEWEERNGKQMAVAQATEGGWYKVDDEVHAGAMAAVLCAGIFMLCVISFMCYYTQTSTGGEKTGNIQTM